MTKLRILLFAVFIVIIAVLIVFPYRNKAPVHIAFLGVFSGEDSQESISARNGAILAVEAVNAGGGIKGRKLKLGVYDLNEGPASKWCRDMEEKRTDLLLAPFVSGDLLRSSINGRQVFCLGEELGKSGWHGPDIVSLHSLAEDCGDAIAGLALGQGIREMAVVYDAFYYPFGLALLEGFTLRFRQRGGEVRTQVTFSWDDHRKVHGLAVEAIGQNPQGVLIIGSAVKTGRLGTEIRRRLPSVALYAAPWAMSDGLVAGGGRSVEGMYGYLWANAGTRQSAAVLSFLSDYQKRFEKPVNLSALYGYEGILILAEGIRNSASPDAFLVKHTLLKMGRFKGLIADYHLGGSSTRAERMVLHQVRKGRITPIE